jgi:hypothetical protein
MNPGVCAAGERFDLLDPEQAVIVNEFKNLDVSISDDDASTALSCPFCNSLRFLHGLNDVPDALRRQFRRTQLGTSTVTTFVTTFLRSPAKWHFQDFPPCRVFNGLGDVPSLSFAPFRRLFCFVISRSPVRSRRVAPDSKDLTAIFDPL